MDRRRLWLPALWLIALLGAAVVGGCRSDKKSSALSPKTTARPSLRLVTLGGAAGAIEPCGCVKDMLGGVDHAAAFIAASRKEVGDLLVLGAGPMFFQDPLLGTEHIAQAELKAHTMAKSLRDLGLTAWAPGANDWARSSLLFSELARESGALPLAKNLEKDAGIERGVTVVDRGGFRIGLVGLSVPKFPGKELGFQVGDAQAALLSGIQELRGKGAQILVGLIAAPRGEALRLVERAPGLSVAVVGKPFDQGEDNDAPFEPMVLGETLVVQGQNHLQAAVTVDLYVRDGSFAFQDGSGILAAQKRASLKRRIEQLEGRLPTWRDPKSGVAPARVAEKEKELAALKVELKASNVPEPPGQGSYFLYDLTFVKEDLGEDPAVGSRLSAYYKRVNELNRERFAEKVPVAAAAGESSYVGVDVCTTCHQEERAFWQTTRHASAYETLANSDKQFNLDCVSCHVTGYERPGGSTVTFVEKLKSVQCENCHGPGSAHVTNPADPQLIRPMPPVELCSTCHHPPHVTEDWRVEDAWPQILGPGHGLPK